MFDDDRDRVTDWAGGGGWQDDSPPPSPPPPPPPKKKKKPVPQPVRAFRERKGRGLVAGRFDPLHRGHELLVETARRSSDALDIVVFSSPNDAVPVATRMRWLSEAFPGVPVYDTVRIDDFAAAIANATKRPPKYDVFYGGEMAAGIAAARSIGATFVPVDPNREAVAMSGTDLRSDVMAHFDGLAAVARPWFVRRVAVVGAESTGKTELCKRLAKIYSTSWVPEPARSLADVRGGDLDWDAIELWARTQMASEDAVARHARRVLFADTDVATVRAWARRMFDTSPLGLDGHVQARPYDLHLVCTDDVPFVGRPERDDPQGRREMAKHFGLRTKEGGVIVYGSFENRLLMARKAVDQLLAKGGFLSARGDAMARGVLSG